MTLRDWTNKSKNYTKGREGRKVKFLAIHWLGTKGATGESSAKYLLNNDKNTSAHYVVEDDNVWKLVNTEDTAHAVGYWIGNLESISIEMSATVDREANDLTYRTTAELIRLLVGLYKLEINTITIKPHNFFGVTQCPGTINIPKIIELATGGTTESDKDKKIAELEKEKDKFERLSEKQAKTIKIMENDARELQKERDVFHDISERTSQEVVDLKVSVADAIKKASDWEADYIELETQLTKTNNLYNKQVGVIEKLEAENKILHTANKDFVKYSQATKLFKYKNYLLVLIEDIKL